MYNKKGKQQTKIKTKTKFKVQSKNQSLSQSRGGKQQGSDPGNRGKQQAADLQNIHKMNKQQAAGWHKKDKQQEQGLIWGRHPVLESLKALLPLQEICLQDGVRGGVIEEIRRYAQKMSVPVKEAIRQELDQKAPGANHQGVIALVPSYDYLTPDELLHRDQKAGRVPFLLMLDHLQDPYNFGSLLRTASLTDVSGAVIPKDRACGVTPGVFKGSAGALSHVPVARSVNLARELDYFKKEGLWIIGADMDGDTPFFEADLQLPMVLILGGEDKGLSRLLKDKCDFLLRIPTGQAVSSLNVAVAGGIIMYEVFRQRRQAAASR